MRAVPLLTRRAAWLAVGLGLLGCRAPSEAEASRASTPTESNLPGAVAAEVAAAPEPARWLAHENAFQLREVRAARTALTMSAPALGSAAFSLDLGTLHVGLHRVGAGPASGVPRGNAVEYRNITPGVDALFFSEPSGVEELLTVHEPMAVAARYTLDVPPHWQLRASPSGDLVELLDTEGIARARVSVPRAWDAAGAPILAQLSVSNREIALNVGEIARFPAVVDPLWSGTGSLTVERKRPYMVLLPSGKVLVGGGLGIAGTAVSFSLPQSTAELFDPVTRTFTRTGSMLTARKEAGAVLLPSGLVLVGGGAAAAAEIYDPALGTFRAVGSLVHPRVSPTATLLGNGLVLFTGGIGAADSTVQHTAETYDPASETFTATGDMVAGRFQHTATRLASGQVLLAGGQTNDAELYDPAARSFTAVTGKLSEARSQFVAVLLPSGKVLLAGPDSSAEIYDPALKTFAATGALSDSRTSGAAVLLPSGKVLVSGGCTRAIFGSSCVDHQSSDLFDPTANAGVGAFQAGVDMQHPRSGHLLTVLPTGDVLAAGGTLDTSAEVYNPSATAGVGQSVSLGAASFERSEHVATVLPTGKVLLAGGCNSAVTFGLFGCSDPWPGALLFDGATKALTATGNLVAPRINATATLLGSGQVLVVGGSTKGTDSISAVNTAELYDPGAGTFSALTATMAVPRSGHTATTLSSGKVLVVGGAGGSTDPTLAEIFDPATSRFRSLTATQGHDIQSRAHATATLLLSGQVLIAGGTLGDPRTALFDPATETFRVGPSLSTPRVGHTAALLSSGKVLICGGSNVASCELYDPSTQLFAAAASMGSRRTNGTATTLVSGKILEAGGGASTSELYDPATDSFTPAVALQGAHAQGSSTLLPNGNVLLAGNENSTGAIAEVWDEQRIGNEAWRPSLTSVPKTVTATSTYSLTGTGFLGIGEASDGTGYQSATAYPSALWFPLAGGGPVFGTVSAWSATTASWIAPVTSLTGPGLLVLATNGVPSVGVETVLNPAPQGSPCDQPGQCASLFCVDGFCCNTDCNGECQACAGALKVSGDNGVCGNAAAASDPHDDCNVEAPETCGNTGVCNGAGACEKQASGTVCVAAACSGLNLAPAHECDGAGVCSRTQVQSCAPFVCSSVGGGPACTTACVSSSDCAVGAFCRDKLCVSPQANGATCMADAECATSHCVDGVCCNTTCRGQCEACDLPDSPGLCSAVQGEAPHGARGACTNAGAECGGYCDGVTTATCHFPDSTSACGTGSCKSGQALASACDGAGVCQVGAPQTCEPYGCGATQCNTRCTSASDCFDPDKYRCDGVDHTCKPRDVAACQDLYTVVDPQGVLQPCAPYQCLGGACRSSCSTTAECADGYYCYASAGLCVIAVTYPDNGASGCGCVIPGGPRRPIPRAPAAAALALLALTVAARRRSSAAALRGGASR